MWPTLAHVCWQKTCPGQSIPFIFAPSHCRESILRPIASNAVGHVRSFWTKYGVATSVHVSLHGLGEGGGGGGLGEGGGGGGRHGTHDVAVPSELQVSVHGPARAHAVHRELCRDVSSCMWCGCVSGWHKRSRDGWLAWWLGHGARGGGNE